MTTKTSEAYLEDIQHYLTALAISIRISNYGFGFYNVNKYSEDCLARVLGIIHGTRFRVLEYSKINQAGIDLVSEDHQWAYQITSTGRALKLKESIRKYFKNDLHEKYQTLRFLILKEKYNPRVSNEKISDFLKTNNQSFSSLYDDVREGRRVFDIKLMVFDLSNLAKLIKEYCNNHQLEQVANILKVEYSYLEERESISRLMAFKDYIESINNKLEKLTPIDALTEIPKIFYPIGSYPKFILLKLYPLSIGDNRALYRNFSIRTVNKELITELKTHEEKYSDTRLSDIGRFFTQNYIYTISFHSKNFSIDLRQYHNQSTCGCSRCTFNRFEFQKSFIRLSSEAVVQHPKGYEYENLRSAYTYYMFGDFIKAFNVLTNLSEYAVEKRDYISHFLCEYNLSNMGRSLDVNCKSKAEMAVYLSRTKTIKTDLLISSYYGKGTDKEVINLLKWIEESRYVDSNIIKLSDLLEGIRQEHQNDKRGKLQKKSFDASLIDALVQSIGFSNQNLLIINKFDNYQRLTKLIFEAYILKNDMLCTDNQKIEPNAAFFIDHFILSSKPSDLKIVINKYRIYNSPYYVGNDNSIPPFISKLNNLINNLDFLNDYIGEREGSFSPNYHLKFRVNDFVANSLYICTAFNIKQEHLDIFYLLVLRFFQKFKYCNVRSAEALSFGLGVKFSKLSQKTKKQLFALIDSSNHIIKQNLSLDLFLEDNDFASYRLARVEANFEKMINASNEEQVRLCLEVFSDVEILEESLKKIFADQVISLLENEFNVVLAFFAVQESIIDFNEYLPKFIKHVKISVDKASNRRRQLPHRYIEDLNLFLSLLFEHNVELSQSELEALNPGSEYYNWLFNMDQFDYNNFDPFWILRFRSSGFIAKYRSSKNLVEAVGRFLKEAYNPAIGEFFVQELL